MWDMQGPLLLSYPLFYYHILSYLAWSTYSPRARSSVRDPDGDMATFIDDVVPNFWILPAKITYTCVTVFLCSHWILKDHDYTYSAWKFKYVLRVTCQIAPLQCIPLPYDLSICERTPDNTSDLASLLKESPWTISPSAVDFFFAASDTNDSWILKKLVGDFRWPTRMSRWS